MPPHRTPVPCRQPEVPDFDAARATVSRDGMSVLWGLDVVNKAAGRADIRQIGGPVQ